jgi:ADP-ribose pyrophosphatase YjhB (NUDIX family)
MSTSTKQDFADPEQLERWLQERGVNTAVWNQDDAKTVRDLWREIQAGESVLQENPLRRRVELVEIVAQQNGRFLIEAEQELVAGARRRRHIPPSEKMHPNENVLDAARRGLREELHLTPEQVELDVASEQRREREAPSLSYPGLTTHYVIHRVETAVSGLPEESFWRENLAFGDGDPVRRQRWEWVEERPEWIT